MSSVLMPQVQALYMEKKKYSFEVTYRDGIVYAFATGEDSYEASFDLWSELVSVCDMHNCFNIVGVQKMTALSVIDAFDMEKIFRELGVSMKYNVAWVEEEDPATREMLEYAAAVMRNRKLLNGGIFDNKRSAIEWIQSQQKA